MCAAKRIGAMNHRCAIRILMSFQQFKRICQFFCYRCHNNDYNFKSLSAVQLHVIF